MAEETTEKKEKEVNMRSWWPWKGTKSYKSKFGRENAKQLYIEAVTKLEKLQSRLSAIYKDPNIANRQYALKKLEVELGTRDFAKVVRDLRAQKDYTYKVLSSPYVKTPPIGAIGVNQDTLDFHNDGELPLSGDVPYAYDGNINIGNNLNPYYDPFYDFDSKETNDAIKKAGVTKEEYVRQWTNEHGFPEDALNFLDPKNKSTYVDPNDGTDLWGRLPSDADYTIDPAIVAGRKEDNGKNKNSANEFDQSYGIEDEEEDEDDTIIDNNAVDKKKIDKVDESNDIKNNNSIEEVTPNREDLMAKRFKERAAEIENKPSRIQKGLMEDTRWTSDRLAKLSIKDQDFQKAKGSKELMIQFKKDKAAGVYS